jgi:hypothetical protein
MPLRTTVNELSIQDTRGTGGRYQPGRNHRRWSIAVVLTTAMLHRRGQGPGPRPPGRRDVTWCPGSTGRAPENSFRPCDLGLCWPADGGQVAQDCFSVISPGNLAMGFVQGRDAVAGE